MQVVENKVGLILQQGNAGQVARLKLLPPDELPVYGAPQTVSLCGLAVADGTQLTELVFPAGGCTMQEVSQVEPAGTAWSLELVDTLPRNQPALIDWLQTNQGRRWLAIWLDRNGQAYVAGKPGNGLRMEVTRSIAGQNSVTVTLKGRFSHAAWFLETFDTASLFADLDYDLAFDLSYNA